MEDIIYKGFVIKQISNGSFRVARNDGSNKHTHLRNLKPCYRLINNVANHIIPTRCGLYYLESHIRLADDDNYRQKLEDYYNVKVNKGKKQNYINSNKKKL